MDKSVLKFLPDFGVLLCTACTKPHCLPGSIDVHMRRFHQTFNSNQRGAMVEYAKSLASDLKSTEEVKATVPPRENGPVEGLYVNHQGYECLMCEYVCGSLQTMEEKHCPLAHQWTKEKPDMWRVQPIQVHSLTRASLTSADFVDKPSMKYFPVDKPAPKELAPDLQCTEALTKHAKSRDELDAEENRSRIEHQLLRQCRAWRRGEE